MAYLIPKELNEIRKDAVMHENGQTIMNAATLYYGGAKTGKTRLITRAFNGSNYIFLDFDRNYESTIKQMQANGATYYNGKNAKNVLVQLMNGKISNEIIIIDALGAVISSLCRAYIDANTVTNESGNQWLTEEGQVLKEAYESKSIGNIAEPTRIFFNSIIEPMTRNGNSVNFIHHTTQNAHGEKMEGNKGVWLSLFDFTYEMNRETKNYHLIADRLPIAPATIGEDNVFDRINAIIESSKEAGEVDGAYVYYAPYKAITDNKTARKVVDEMVRNGVVKKVKVSRKEYLDVELRITVDGQCIRNEDLWTPLYKSTSIDTKEEV